MMGYLQRLVVRAEGVSTAPSLAPTGHRQTTEDQTNEPFIGDDVKMPAAKSLTRPSSVVPDAKVRRVELEHKGERSLEAPRPNESNDSRPSVSEQTQVVPPLVNETLVALPNKREPKNQQRVQRQDEVEVDVETVESRRPHNIDPVVTEPNIEDSLSLQEAAQVTASSRLEPRHVEVPDHESPATAEPRLVIGQLKVEVVSTPPTRPREIVGTVTRAADSNQTRMPESSISRLRFGLGQI